MPIASSLLKKPRLVKKLKDFYEYVKYNDGKVGTKTRGIDLNFNNACNLGVNIVSLILLKESCERIFRL